MDLFTDNECHDKDREKKRAKICMQRDRHPYTYIQRKRINEQTTERANE